MKRSILHVDLNNFYASVECLYRPDIRDECVVVGGDIKKRHGIVLAKNQNAKKYGVKTGETIWQALIKCPKLISVPPNFELYMRYSCYLKNMLYEYSNQVESFGLDEAWVDISDSLKKFGSSENIAKEISRRIKSEMGVTASIGISWNKIFAKLGSDMNKPNGITMLSKENYKEKVWPLDSSELLYVGRATKQKLSRGAILTIGDIANSDPIFLKSILGKWGLILYEFANGMDKSEVRDRDHRNTIKGIGNSTTTPRDLTCFEDVSLVCFVLAESIAMRLRESGLECKTVQISLRDKDLVSFERQCKLHRATCLSKDIHDAALKLAKDNYNFKIPLRSMGIRAVDLQYSQESAQLSILEDEDKRRKSKKLEECVTELRGRYGNKSIRRAVLYSDVIGEINPKDDHVIHPISFFKEALPL